MRSAASSPAGAGERRPGIAAIGRQAAGMTTLRSAFVLGTLALLLAACASSEPGRPLSPAAVERLNAVHLDPAEAGRILNAYRASKGLGPVRPDPRLMAMAQHQADAMARGNTLSHDAGGSFTSRVHGAGLDAMRTAENLGGGYFSTQEAFDGWQRSSGHNANLLMPEATRYGIALAKNPETQYRAWWALVVASEPEQRRTLSAGPLVPARNETFRWGPSP